MLSMLEQEKDRLDFSSLSHYIPVVLKYVSCVSGILSEFLVNLSKWRATISDEPSVCYRKTTSALLEKIF